MPKVDPADPIPRRVWLEETVLDAAVRRLRTIFDACSHVTVSISGGKDSTVAAHLAAEEARRRRRDVTLLFLDQEAEYAGTVRQVERLMTLPGVRPLWYQVPLRLTSAVSRAAPVLHAWDPAAEGEWIHPRHPLATVRAPGAPDRFYPFLNWHERQRGTGAGIVIGLRAGESFHRYISVTRFPGLEGLRWTSRGEGRAIRAYPLYDWAAADIWTLLGTRGLAYNEVYDRLWALGLPERELRVSNLIHEMSYHSLTRLQQVEPLTYERLIRRVPGARTAALYAEEDLMYRARELPAAHPSWQAYRDALLETFPPEAQARFRARFAAQPDDPRTHRLQVRQLQIGDVEGRLQVRPPSKKKESVRDRWMSRL